MVCGLEPSNVRLLAWDSNRIVPVSLFPCTVQLSSESQTPATWHMVWLPMRAITSTNGPRKMPLVVSRNSYQSLAEQRLEQQGAMPSHDRPHKIESVTTAAIRPLQRSYRTCALTCNKPGGFPIGLKTFGVVLSR